jgi:hypothetical protein
MHTPTFRGGISGFNAPAKLLVERIDRFILISIGCQKTPRPAKIFDFLRPSHYQRPTDTTLLAIRRDGNTA